MPAVCPEDLVIVRLRPGTQGTLRDVALRSECRDFFRDGHVDELIENHAFRLGNLRASSRSDGCSRNAKLLFLIVSLPIASLLRLTT